VVVSAACLGVLERFHWPHARWVAASRMGLKVAVDGAASTCGLAAVISSPSTQAAKAPSRRFDSALFGRDSPTGLETSPGTGTWARGGDSTAHLEARRGESMWWHVVGS
jgi:hypothetical protein